MIDVIFGEHLCFALGHHQLLDNTEFRLKRGEHLGLIGRNGTGKSSFLKILAGLIPLDDGIFALNAIYQLSILLNKPY